MAEFKNKNKHSFWYSPIVLLLLFLLVIFLSYKVIGLVKKEVETEKKKEVVINELEDLKAREKFLSDDIKKFETKEGIEDAIRDKYQVVKEGEKMVIILDTEENVNQDNQVPEHVGFIGWIKNLFIKSN